MSFYKNHSKNLKQIILVSSLSSLYIVLGFIERMLMIKNSIFAIFFAFPFLSRCLRQYNVFAYINLLPLIIMSLYVPGYFACLGVFLSEFLLFCFKGGNIALYDPLFGIILAFCFGFLPSIMIKIKDSFLNMFLSLFFILLVYRLLYILTIFYRYQTLSWKYLFLRIQIETFFQISSQIKNFLGLQDNYIVLYFLFFFELCFWAMLSLLLVVIMRKLIYSLNMFNFF